MSDFPSFSAYPPFSLCLSAFPCDSARFRLPVSFSPKNRLFPDFLPLPLKTSDLSAFFAVFLCRRIFRPFLLISFSSSGFHRISRNLRAFLRQSEVFYLFFRLQTFICRFPVFHGILADLHYFSAVRLVFVSFPTLQTDMQCFQANPLFVRMFRRFYSFHPLKHLATT